MTSIFCAVSRRVRRMSIYSSTNRSKILEKSETVKQALLYTSTFLLAFASPILHSVLKIIFGPEFQSQVLVVLTAILFPLQGFFNFALYIRPGVNRIRKRNPGTCLIEAVRQVVFNVRSVGSTENPCVIRVNEDNDSSVYLSSEDNSIARVDSVESDQTPSISKEINHNKDVTLNDRPNTRRRSLVEISSVLSQFPDDDLNENSSNETPSILEENNVIKDIAVNDRPRKRRHSLIEISTVLSQFPKDDLEENASI